MPVDFISSISRRELRAAELSRLFVGGAGAVMLRGDGRVQRLTDAILEWLEVAERHGPNWQDPFGKNLVNLARNHVTGNMLLGDILRFEPGRIVHIARKFIVYERSDDQSLCAIPDRFYVGNRPMSMPCGIKELAAGLMSEVYSSAQPGSRDFHSSYAIQVEVLIYPSSRSDVEALGHTLADSCGRWSRWGYLIDAPRNKAHGIFDVKIVRDVYALCSLLPGVGRWLGMLNTRMTAARTEPIPNDCFLLGRAHVDEGKYITALAGCRDNLQTEVLDAGAWIPLEVSPDALAVFPSAKMTRFQGIRATSHRILLRDSPGCGDVATRNISLALSIIDRPKWLA